MNRFDLPQVVHVVPGNQNNVISRRLRSALRVNADSPEVLLGNILQQPDSGFTDRAKTAQGLVPCLVFTYPPVRPPILIERGKSRFVFEQDHPNAYLEH